MFWNSKKIKIGKLYYYYQTATVVNNNDFPSIYNLKQKLVFNVNLKLKYEKITEEIHEYNPKHNKSQ